MKQSTQFLFVFALGSLLANSIGRAEEWSVPVAGNAFHTGSDPSGRGFRRDGPVRISDRQSVLSVFFHVDRQAELLLGIKASAPDGRSSIGVTVGEQVFAATIEEADPRVHQLGKVDVSQGYVRVDFQGTEKDGEAFADLFELIVASETDDLKLDYVRDNKGNMFYWGRRGPSVHLRYDVPKDVPIKYAYCEVTVPVGEDPIGSFYMASGFGEGYFGMQVNGPDERRVLFSVWSPFKTDNPREIPEDQRIVALERGEDVRIGEFGNEGSGGQSFLVYPWQPGRAYRFLIEVIPDGQGNTTYASWFGDKDADEWRLIARFRRPQTDTHLRGFHSFLESFSPKYGYIGRKAHYGNVWVGDVDGKWHECTQARFSVDATGRGRHRLDFTGGSDGSTFFLRNCGFFSDTGKPGTPFERESTADQKPQIDFDALPRG